MNPSPCYSPEYGGNYIGLLTVAFPTDIKDEEWQVGGCVYRGVLYRG